MSDTTDTSTTTDEPTAPAADDTTTPAPVATTDAPGGDGDEQLSKEDARKLRSEAKGLRDRLKTAEEELKKRQDAELSTQQKLERDLAAEKAVREQAETAARDLRVQVAAAKLGVRAEAVERVSALIDWTDVDATDGKAVEKAIRELVKEMPFLSARPDGLDGGSGRDRRAVGGSMNELIRRAAGRA